MRNTVITLAAILLLAVGCKNADQSSVIKLPVPPREAGQTDMLQFAADPIENVGIGVVGLGMRGSDAVQRLTFVPGCHDHQTALCVDLRYNGSDDFRGTEAWTG